MAEEFVPRAPDYNVAVLRKSDGLKGNVGVAWRQENGRIQIKLRPFIVLDTRGGDFSITLFPISHGEETKPIGEARGAKQKGGKGGPDPF
jgi:hypothetical protein